MSLVKIRLLGLAMGDRETLKKTPSIVSRELSGEVILFPLYKNSSEMNYIYSLNETGAEIWNLIDGKRTLLEIKKAVMKKYDVDEKKLSKELKELITDLRSIDAIR
jgi:hypothetical protein